MSAKYIPQHVPEELDATETLFEKKRGAPKPVTPEQRVQGRVAWAPIKDPQYESYRKFPYYWREEGKWKLVRSGSRQQIRAFTRLALVDDSGFMSV